MDADVFYGMMMFISLVLSGFLVACLSWFFAYFFIGVRRAYDIDRFVDLLNEKKEFGKKYITGKQLKKLLRLCKIK
ncbi:hypothetical protein ES704_03002 [subsurface metagenome]|jgi:hypothetical protein